jgi:hypothetical protein
MLMGCISFIITMFQEFVPIAHPILVCYGGKGNMVILYHANGCQTPALSTAITCQPFGPHHHTHALPHHQLCFEFAHTLLFISALCLVLMAFGLLNIANSVYKHMRAMDKADTGHLLKSAEMNDFTTIQVGSDTCGRGRDVVVAVWR